MQSSNPTGTTKSLPIEIQGLIIHESISTSSTYSELAQAWTSLRSVSIFFKREVEKAFAEVVLPTSTIQSMPDEEPRAWLELQSQVQYGLTFKEKQLSIAAGSRFSDEFSGNAAIFAFVRCRPDTPRAAFFQRTSYDGMRWVIKEPPKLYPTAFYAILAKRTRALEQREVAHHYTMQVFGVHNDIVIPDIAFKRDGDTMEVNFDWKARFSKLFGEETRHVRLMKDNPSYLAMSESTSHLCYRGRELHDRRPYFRGLRFYDWCRRHTDHITPIFWTDDTFDYEALNDEIDTKVRTCAIEEYHHRFELKEWLYDKYCGIERKLPVKEPAHG